MLGWQPVMQSWINAMPASMTDTYKAVLKDLFERMITPLLEFIRKGGVKVIVWVCMFVEVLWV